MKSVRNRPWTMLLPTVAGLVGVAALVGGLSGAPTASAAPPSTPVNVTFTNTTVVDPSPCSGVIHFAGSGSFTAASPLLGASTYQADVCFNPPDVLSGPFTITAHNGATIFGTGTGTTDVTFTHWTYTITGGTKQFSHASGSLDLTLVATSNEFPGPIIGTGTLVGTIQR